MNIVKIKDIVLNEASGLDVELFNTYFRGRYAYVVNWKWIVRIEDVPSNKFVEFSVNDEVPEDCIKLDLDKYTDYIDDVVTDKINDVSKYIAFNKFVPDDVTIEDLKGFRTWLATTILDSFDITDANINHMLTYYSNDMHDNIIDWLSVFGSAQLALTTQSQSGCGYNKTSGATQSVVATTINSSSCGCGSGNMSGLYLQRLSQCDPIMIYRKNIYLKMVNVFSDMSFWQQFDPEFIEMIMVYIDGIIKADFDLVKSTFTSDFVDCGCVNDNLAAQQRQIARLQKLYNAFKYIVDDDIVGHKTYITTALSEWATYLYEIMEWK